jgi:hypothetical protein
MTRDDDPATKADLLGTCDSVRADLAKLERDLTIRIVGAMALFTAICAAITLVGALVLTVATP